MNPTIHFTQATGKLLVERRGQAYAAGDLRQVRQISALLGWAKDEMVSQVAETFSVRRQMVYNWLKAFMVDGMDS